MIRVAIIEDHRLLADTLAITLKMQTDIELVGLAYDMSEGIGMVRSTRPTVLLLDSELPDGLCFDRLSDISAASPQTKVIVLANEVEESQLLQSIANKTEGYLSKDISLAELILAVQKVAAGRMAMPTEHLVGLINRVHKPGGADREERRYYDQLTPRETEILIELAKGKSGDTIAIHFNIAPLTVRTHIRNIMSKLGVHSRLEAVTYALGVGIIDMPINGYS